ncbi:hypothetical protein [Paraburkholderia tagetis]|uniref:Uncharacterized protein n=1 Tax=Paraburkholderia tagetis TaxID=2913261 RepID=A0A9X1UEA8_9BURK|nr:hypothetical protein [Paraburkholderia tagetis]MCG5073030.1 hypothetical protein [Paraburkholderia tagetis]
MASQIQIQPTETKKPTLAALAENCPTLRGQFTSRLFVPVFPGCQFVTLLCAGITGPRAGELSTVARWASRGGSYRALAGCVGVSGAGGYFRPPLFLLTAPLQETLLSRMRFKLTTHEMSAQQGFRLAGVTAQRAGQLPACKGFFRQYPRFRMQAVPGRPALSALPAFLSFIALFL